MKTNNGKLRYWFSESEIGKGRNTPKEYDVLILLDQEEKN
jgi:hypothetical protein